MKKLLNTVVAFVSRGWVYSPTVCSGRLMHRIRRDAGALLYRWQPNPISQLLRCAWSFENAERDLEERPRLRLAG
jgi:hypothetical protein